MKKVEEFLKEHKKNICKLEQLKIKREGCFKLMELNGTKYTEDESEAIEGLQLRAGNVTDMPVSTGLISSKVERVALNYYKDLCGVNSFETEEIRSNIKTLDYRIAVLETKIKLIESALKLLDAKELFVIENIFFSGYRKNEIVKYFYDKFGYGSRKTIDRDCSNALVKLEKTLN